MKLVKLAVLSGFLAAGLVQSYAATNSVAGATFALTFNTGSSTIRVANKDILAALNNAVTYPVSTNTVTYTAQAADKLVLVTSTNLENPFFAVLQSAKGTNLVDVSNFLSVSPSQLKVSKGAMSTAILYVEMSPTTSTGLQFSIDGAGSWTTGKASGAKLPTMSGVVTSGKSSLAGTGAASGTNVNAIVTGSFTLSGPKVVATPAPTKAVKKS